MVITPWQRWEPTIRFKSIYHSVQQRRNRPKVIVLLITQKHSTIIANNLKIVEVVTNQPLDYWQTRLIERPVEKEKISDIKVLLAGAIIARNKIHVFMNAKEENLEKS